MKTLEILQTILANMPKISQPFAKFLVSLVKVFLSGKGRYNFTNLSRWSEMCERTLRRNYDKRFNFKQFNELLIDLFLDKEPWIAVSDCSYIPKSGKKTYGLDKFWSGCARRVLKGLEISTLALVSVKSGLALSLSVEQTPSGSDEDNRLLFYLQQLVSCSAYLLKKTKYWVVDGFYAKEKAWDQAAALGLFMITKLRRDADMQFIYEGAQKPKGRKRRNGGKIYWKTEEVLSRFEWQGITPEGWQVYSKVVWSVQWKRQLKVVMITTQNKKGQRSHFLLGCSDLELSATTILSYYRLRFAIEFLFRDAKQHLGLTHCQSTKEKRLSFHFQAVMMTLNLALIENHLQGRKGFSLQDIKTDYFNDHWLETIITNLDLNAESIKMHPNYPKLLRLGKLAA